MPKTDEIWPLIAASADSKIPVTISDPDLNDCPILYANLPFEDLVGRSFDDLTSQSLSELFTEPSEAGTIADFLSDVRGRKRATVRLTVDLPSQEKILTQTYTDTIKVSKTQSVTLGCHYKIPNAAASALTDEMIEQSAWLGVRKSLQATMSMQAEALRMRSDGMFNMARLMITRRRLGL